MEFDYGEAFQHISEFIESNLPNGEKFIVLTQNGIVSNVPGIEASRMMAISAINTFYSVVSTHKEEVG